MSLLQQRAPLRWKEWLPLITEQQRLRSVIQIIAYNVKYETENKCEKCSFYYTLHTTTMSAPFYTSEKLESENPKWAELEVNRQFGTAKGVVIRLWQHSEQGDHVITVWGVYFSGLVYLGPKLVSSDPSTLQSNTIIFYMKGGYFTAPHCFKSARSPPTRRRTTQLPSADVKPSYTASSLSRLHTVQHAIKKQVQAVDLLREKITAGGLGHSNEPKESAILRRLMSKGRPRAQYQDFLKIKKETEIVRYKVQLLTQEKDRKLSELRQIAAKKDSITEENQDRGCELMERYRSLNRDVEKLKECRRIAAETKDALSQINSQLMFRRRQLISELNLIYPILQMADDKYTICDVHLPNSEDFAGVNEAMISVGLGFVAHLLHMISYFLNVPLRYPLFHFGSRSTIIDHITDKISEKEREFPLFAKGKEKLQFNYGVYLLNKNIAQLRWYCGLTTSDLRATLPNLADLLNLRPSHSLCGFEVHHRTLSSSSIGSSPSPVNPPRLSSARHHRALKANSGLSFSLDKGLDELHADAVTPTPFRAPEAPAIQPTSHPSPANGNGTSLPLNVEGCWNCDELSVMSAPEQLETLSRNSPVISVDSKLNDLGRLQDFKVTLRKEELASTD
ncbi:UV radiation resistance-associated protein [Nilaparvata lugens]|uniref:UV radiation resistance-associated protein n=1 Tax=Nilaparvata lugens TaxID=108931 RepID=UPI00193D7413|nr:UV radiation resistance-associated protein [Nilaparvata lugens]